MKPRHFLRHPVLLLLMHTAVRSFRFTF